MATVAGDQRRDARATTREDQELREFRELVAPHSPEILGQRTFFHPAWLTPIGLLAIGMFLQRLDHFGLGYVMFRLTSDVEKLPFPMAPVGAQGVTALADASSGTQSWRWRV